MQRMDLILILALVIWGLPALVAFFFCWQGPYTGGGDWRAIPHSILVGILWPIVFLVIWWLGRESSRR